MAVILYPSGVTETFEPEAHTFSDKELLKIFEDYKNIRTARLYEVTNTWCVWGENEEPDDSNYSKLGSDILAEDVFCHVLFIHDTELDPAWMLTDTMILKGYEQFKEELLQFFDAVAENVIRETQQMRQQSGQPNNLILLNTIGPTEDKRVMFEFDPHGQSEEFWKPENFLEFSRRVVGYLNKNYKDQESFVIFADKKSIIVVADESVEFILNKVIEVFEKRENYERCAELNKVMESWKAYSTKKTKKRKRKDK